MQGIPPCPSLSCAELNSRYELKARRCRRSVTSSSSDKVQTKEEAEMAASAIARFHHERTSFFARPLHAEGEQPRWTARVDAVLSVSRPTPLHVRHCVRTLGILSAAVEAASSTIFWVSPSIGRHQASHVVLRGERQTSGFGRVQPVAKAGIQG